MLTDWWFPMVSHTGHGVTLGCSTAQLPGAAQAAHGLEAWPRHGRGAWLT